MRKCTPVTSLLCVKCVVTALHKRLTFAITSPNIQKCVPTLALFVANASKGRTPLRYMKKYTMMKTIPVPSVDLF